MTLVSDVSKSVESRLVEKTSTGNTEKCFNANDQKHVVSNWDDISWKYVERHVARLQSKIAVAAINEDHKLVRDLQRLLVKSYAAKFIAVRQVAQINTGKFSSGLDGQLWLSPQRKLREALELNPFTTSYDAVKEVKIPKKQKGQFRTLGIPTIRDRALQMLWKLALEPVAEVRADDESFGYRKLRDAEAAAAQIRMNLSSRTQGKRTYHYVLEADIKGFFDNISHDWLLKNIPMDTKVLQAMLSAGVIMRSDEQPAKDSDTSAGTPQGGVLSPVLANIVLDGLQKAIHEGMYPTQKLYTDKKGGFTYFYKKTNKRDAKRGNRIVRKQYAAGYKVVRYADDFIVCCRGERRAHDVKKIVNEFLSDRGLELNEEKTVVTSVADGFDFLGWNFKMTRSNKFWKRPSHDNMSAHEAKLKELLKRGIPNSRIELADLFMKINVVKRGWMAYHKGCDNLPAYSDGISFRTWDKCFKYLKHTKTRMLVPDFIKKHLVDRPGVKGGRNMTFFANDPSRFDYSLNTPHIVYLEPHQTFYKHIDDRRPEKGINPFLTEHQPYVRWWQSYKAQRTHQNSYILRILKNQSAVCPVCDQFIDPDIHSPSVLPKLLGDKSRKIKDVQAVHFDCRASYKCYKGYHPDAFDNFDKVCQDSVLTTREILSRYNPNLVRPEDVLPD